MTGHRLNADQQATAQVKLIDDRAEYLANYLAAGAVVDKAFLTEYFLYLVQDSLRIERNR